MAERLFDRDTLLDLTVNVIPLGIIAFFIGLYTIYRPFGWDVATMAIVYALHVIPFVGLAVLTYFSARAISRDEEEAEKTATEHDVGEQPRTHRYTDDSSEGGDGDGGVGIDRENAPGDTAGPAADNTAEATHESTEDAADEDDSTEDATDGTDANHDDAATDADEETNGGN